MKLFYDKKSKDPTYYAQQGIRNGKKTTTKNVRNFGKHSELLKITDDPLAYVQEEIRKMNEEYRVGRVQLDYKVDFNERVAKTDANISESICLNTGYFFIQSILGKLRLKEYFDEITSSRKNTYDCYTILRFLTYARILDPRSKYGTWDRLSTYYEKPEFGYQHILRFMDILEEHYTEYLEWLYRNSGNVVKRDASVVYYDCTNFYFECEQEDEGYIDEVTGEVYEGLRRYGYSKEHRPNPVVEMGLLMDRNGIPVSMCLHPGNTNEQVTAIPLEKEVLKNLNGAKFIYCADSGLGSFHIRQFNSMGGRAFIVTQSLKKLSKELNQAVFNDSGYRLLSDGRPVSVDTMKSFDRFDSNNRQLYEDFACKVIEADRAMDLGLYEEKTVNGRKVKVKAAGILKQKLIVTFSRKAMEYQRAVRERQVERAKSLIASGDPEEVKKGPNDVRRFMKRIVKTKSGEKAAVTYELDEDKIREEEKYDGYYAVATNLDDPAKEILKVSHRRYQIEACFRIMKTNLSSRPVNHSAERRIRAHFLLCYTALLVHRLMECRLDMQKTHLTPSTLIETMKNINVANVHDVEYMALYKGSRALDALNMLTGLGLDFAHYRPKDLNKKIKKLLT